MPEPHTSPWAVLGGSSGILDVLVPGREQAALFFTGEQGRVKNQHEIQGNSISLLYEGSAKLPNGKLGLYQVGFVSCWSIQIGNGGTEGLGIMLCPVLLLTEHSSP